MEKLFYFFGLGVFGLLAAGGRIAFIIARASYRSGATGLGIGATAPRAVKVVARPAPVQVNMPVAVEPAADTGPETVFINDSNFAGADRILSIKLEPPVGTLYLRLFYATQTVKRELIIWEPKLKRLLGGRKHDLPDVKYESLNGLEPIKDESIAMVESLINERGCEKVRGVKPPKKAYPLTLPKEKETTVKVQPAPHAPAQLARSQPPEQTAGPVQPPHVIGTDQVYVPKVRQGYTYVGQLLHAGPRRVIPSDRAPYEVFEVTIKLDNGAELPLRGAELERALLQNGCEVRDRISVTPMGKVPVELSSGGKAEKNLYKVQKVAAAARS